MKTIIVDVDGTLSYCGDRSPYDYSKVNEDKVNEVLRYILIGLCEDFRIVILTGRDDDSEDITVEWLKENRIPFDEIFMRTTGDKRPDEIVKKEIFDEYLSKDEIFCVFEDRPKVIRMWKELGLFVFDCNLKDPREDF